MCVLLLQSQLPPVWALAAGIEETSTSGISSAKDHFIQRGRCLDELSRLGEDPRLKSTEWDENHFISSAKSVWVTAYQKCVFLSSWDIATLYSDPK